MQGGADLPGEFVALRRRLGPALAADEYWAVGGLDNEELEYYLQAAAFVIHGNHLLKFRKGGREKPHTRFVKVRAAGPPPPPRARRATHACPCPAGAGLAGQQH
jgi:hypothetical protein